LNVFSLLTNVGNLQKVPAAQRFFLLHTPLGCPKSRNSLLNSLFAGNSSRDGCDQHCVASHAVTASEKPSPQLAERPTIAGLLRFCGRLQTPEFTKSEANLPKVSSRSREYSRFWETNVGDWVRSSLRRAGPSRICTFLHSFDLPISRSAEIISSRFGAVGVQTKNQVATFIAGAILSASLFLLGLDPATAGPLPGRSAGVGCCRFESCGDAGSGRLCLHHARRRTGAKATLDAVRRRSAGDARRRIGCRSTRA
jgi:hypothetical protein